MDRASISTLHQELYYLIIAFLRSGPCHASADTLQQETLHHGLLPTYLDWNGCRIQRSFDQLTKAYSHIPHNYLLSLFSKLLLYHGQKHSPQEGLLSVLGAGSTSVITPQDIKPTKVENGNLSLALREYKGFKHSPLRPPRHLYHNFSKIGLTKGHTSAVFCAQYDRTGTRFITGGDDGNVKIWDVKTGWLIMTLRGHVDVITDLAINRENTLVASSSSDGSVRVWNLQTGKPIGVLFTSLPAPNRPRQGINGIHFSPSPYDQTRFLLGTGDDGMIRLWRWQKCPSEAEPAKFLNPQEPIILSAKDLVRDDVKCAAFNRTGTRFVTAGSDGFIRIWSTLSCFAPEEDETSSIEDPQESEVTTILQNREPILIARLDQHVGSVTDLVYSHLGDRILSGSVDGTCCVWQEVIRNDVVTWESVTLDARLDVQPPIALQTSPNSDQPEAAENVQVESTTEDGETDVPVLPAVGVGAQTPRKISAIKIVTCTWSSDDSKIISTWSDGYMRIWDSKSGILLHTVRCVAENPPSLGVYVISPHPTDPSVFLTAGHDCRIVLWDIQAKPLKTWLLEAPALEAQFDPVGTMFICTDIEGFSHVYSMSGNQYAVPVEQYFEIDFVQLQMDACGFVVEASSQLPPHLLQRTPVISEYGALNNQQPPSTDFGLHLPISISGTFEREQEDLEELLAIERQRSTDLNLPKPPQLNKRQLYKRRTKIIYESDESDHEPVVMPNILIPDDSSGEEYQHDSDDEGEYEGIESDEDQSEEEFVLSDAGSDVDNRPRQKKKTKKVHKRSRKQPRLASPDYEEYDEDYADNEDDFVSTNGDRPARKKRKLSDEKPPSTGSSSRRRAPVIKKEETLILPEDELYRFLPSEWISMKERKETPYFPQVGDFIVYFREGHGAFIDSVKKEAKKMKDMDISRFTNDLPWEKFPNLNVVEYGKIVDLNFSVGPPTFCTISIALLDLRSSQSPYLDQWTPPEEPKRKPRHVTISYRDQDGVADFIFLLSRYHFATETNLTVGEDVLALYDADWWPGVVEDVKTETPWLQYGIRFEDGSLDYLSRWELRKEGDGEWKDQIYEWERLGEADIDIFTGGFKKVMNHSLSLFFREPVDFESYPDYYVSISYPISLSDIIERLQNGYYRRTDAILFDIQMIATNAETYNIPESEIVKKAKELVKIIVEFVKNPSYPVEQLLPYEPAVDQNGYDDDEAEYKDENSQEGEEEDEEEGEEDAEEDEDEFLDDI